MKDNLNLKLKYICFSLILLLVSCSSSSDKNKVTSSDKSSDKISFENLNLPTDWIELTKQGNDWIYQIPCVNLRELKSVKLRKIKKQNAIDCNFGTEGQGFSVKEVKTQGDSLLFTTVLPYDTNSIVPISMKIINKEKNFARWIIDGDICLYIPTKDTIKYKRIIQTCDNVCYKCDIEKIKDLDANCDKLTIQIVTQFLCTFDNSCKNNIEYSEFSNEILFKLLDKSPTLFFQVLSKEHYDNKLFVSEIENPLLDYNLQEIYNKVKATSVPIDLKAIYLNALIKASTKTDKKIAQ